MSAGEEDLSALLRGLAPVLDPLDYVFITGTADQEAHYTEPFAVVREREGLTYIVAADTKADVPRMRRIELTVHSSLAAVGLTAAVATALTAHNISANVVAAFYHDHIFVAAADAERALKVLQDLSAEAR
ncbi:MAG: ACT domain-containing protein [Pseudomonadota bacterium]